MKITQKIEQTFEKKFSFLQQNVEKGLNIDVYLNDENFLAKLENSESEDIKVIGKMIIKSKMLLKKTEEMINSQDKNNNIKDFLYFSPFYAVYLAYSIDKEIKQIIKKAKSLNNPVLDGHMALYMKPEFIRKLIDFNKTLYNLEKILGMGSDLSNITSIIEETISNIRLTDLLIKNYPAIQRKVNKITKEAYDIIKENPKVLEQFVKEENISLKRLPLNSLKEFRNEFSKILPYLIDFENGEAEVLMNNIFVILYNKTKDKNIIPLADLMAYLAYKGYNKQLGYDEISISTKNFADYKDKLGQLFKPYKIKIPFADIARSAIAKSEADM